MNRSEPKKHTSPEEQKRLREELSKQIAELAAGDRRCETCGGQMAHYRLFGYRCARGCR
jgi:hypothetical protein